MLQLVRISKNNAHWKYKECFFMHWINWWKKIKGVWEGFKGFSKTVQNNLGGTCKISILDINNKEVSI